MNQANFVGRIVRPIEVKELATGSRVIQNAIALHRPHRRNEGEEVSDFIPFVAWNNYAEILEKYCSKGDQVALSGRMQSRSYENKEKKMVYIVECNVESITLVASSQRRKEIANDVSIGSSEVFSVEDKDRIEEVLLNIKAKEKTKL